MEGLFIQEGTLSNSLQDIRQELDEHLEVINENTDEIESNFSYLINLEKKIKFLEQRLERMEHALLKVGGIPEERKERKKIRILDSEQEVFLIIYNSPKALDYQEIARIMRRSETYLRYQITGLVNKGVPITKHVINRKTFFSLDPEFKSLQCTENILNLSRTLTLDCFDQSIV